jgi:hypothetical protein
VSGAVDILDPPQRLVGVRSALIVMVVMTVMMVKRTEMSIAGFRE